VPSYTTNPSLSEPYKIISEEEFHTRKMNNEFIETTTYGEYEYGVHVDDIDRKKKNVLVLDICGAMAMKKYLPKCTTVYVKTSTEKMIQHVLEMDTSTNEKMKRLMSLDDEIRNEEICDHVIKIRA